MFNASQQHLSRRQMLGLTLGAAIAQVPQVSAQGQRVYTFLVLGLDTREENADQRSDIVMIARVDLTSNSVRTLSIPRDLYVEIPGYGYDKINAAYQRGLASSPELDWTMGADLAVQTIEHNFGVRIEGIAITDMNRFPAIIDAVGGVDVDNPYAVDDPTWTEASFPAGLIHLDGARALVFTRTRKMDGDGGRVMRQHLVLAALLGKLQEPTVLPEIPGLAATLTDAVMTDISPGVQAQLLAMLPNIGKEDLFFTNIEPLLWADYTAGGVWIYQGDWSTLAGYVQSWLDGTVE